jgi:hypothetical protein
VLTPSTPFAFPQVVGRHFACFRVDPRTGTIAFPQLIPEGAGTVKTTAGCFFRLFASFLILVGASK